MQIWQAAKYALIQQEKMLQNIFEQKFFDKV